MTACSRLNDLRQSLHNGHWPAAAPPDLRDHVATCPRCSQELLLTTQFQLARADAIHTAQPTPPSLVWWRAQARRRSAALQQAGRPLAAAYAFAFVIVLAAIAGLIATHWDSIVTRAASAPTATASSLTSLLDTWGLAPTLLAGLLLLTLTSVAVYLTTRRS